MRSQITIRTGTRDELAGIDVGFVNVYEREERPGQPSVQLILPDRTVILAVGDMVEIGGRQFRLLSLTPDRGAYQVAVEEVPSAAPPEPAGLAIPPTAAGDMRVVLRHLTPAILGHLAAGGPVPELEDWVHDASEVIHTEWNGGEIGPNSRHHDRAMFAPVDGLPVEASVTLEVVRYHPDEVYRREVSAFWRYGGTHAHVFMRAEGEARLDHITGETLDPAILALIREALASK